MLVECKSDLAACTHTLPPADRDHLAALHAWTADVFDEVVTCSALTQEGLKNVFDTAIRVVLDDGKTSESKKGAGEAEKSKLQTMLEKPYDESGGSSTMADTPTHHTLLIMWAVLWYKFNQETNWLQIFAPSLRVHQSMHTLCLQVVISGMSHTVSFKQPI